MVQWSTWRLGEEIWKRWYSNKIAHFEVYSSENGLVINDKIWGRLSIGGDQFRLLYCTHGPGSE